MTSEASDSIPKELNPQLQSFINSLGIESSNNALIFLGCLLDGFQIGSTFSSNPSNQNLINSNFPQIHPTKIQQQLQFSNQQIQQKSNKHSQSTIKVNVFPSRASFQEPEGTWSHRNALSGRLEPVPEAPRRGKMVEKSWHREKQGIFGDVWI